MKTIKIATLFAAGLMLAACTTNSSAPLLEGKSWCDPEIDMALNYMPEDNLLSAEVLDIVPGEDSTFSFSYDFKNKADAYELYVGTKIYGVYLEKGQTLGMEIRPVEGENEAYELTFTGKNAAESNFASKMFAAYDIYEYGAPDDDTTTYEEYLEKLNSRHDELVAELPSISNRKVRAEFAKQVEYNYYELRLIILNDEASKQNVEPKTIEGYDEIVSKCNPDDIYCLRSGFVFTWLFSQTDITPEFGGDYSAYCIDILSKIDNSIKNEASRKACYGMVASYFFNYGDHETGKQEFWDAFCNSTKDFPELAQSYQHEYEKVVKKLAPMPVPDVTLTNPDGKSVSLKDACMGKVTYIDVWATWCGPCCREIPHLEEVVEAMKGNTAINFISISVDEDIDAWKEKINEDKPAWAQYRVDEANNEALCDALNIRGIPRFMIVNSEGIIEYPDAIRPSDPEIQSTLESVE